MNETSVRRNDFLDDFCTQFKTDGYVYVPKIVEPWRVLQLFEYTVQRAKSGRLESDSQVAGAPASYSDPATETLLLDLLPSIERVTGLRLFPTYSYYRVYRKDTMLRKHMDRPACEISVSISVGCTGSPSWPLWIENSNGPAKYEIDPGDALVYRGILPHWREPFAGSLASQIFLHYVDRDGPNVNWKFDRRAALGVVPERLFRVTRPSAFVLVGGHGLKVDGKVIELGEVQSAMWAAFEDSLPIAPVLAAISKKFSLSRLEVDAAFMDFFRWCQERELIEPAFPEAAISAEWNKAHADH